MKDIRIKKILDIFRGSNSIEINTKIDKPPNFESPFDINLSQLETIALKYYELVTFKGLGELEAEQLDKILEQAETDEKLSLLLNKVDELTFQELGFYEQDSLERVKQQKAKVEEVIINSEKTEIVDCINKLQSISGYQNILNEYYKLITLEELSELEARQLDKILEQAGTDEKLSLLLNEVDELTFQELGFYEQDSLERVENQKSETKKCIERILNPTNNLTSNQVRVPGVLGGAGTVATGTVAPGTGAAAGAAGTGAAAGAGAGAAVPAPDVVVVGTGHAAHWGNSPIPDTGQSSSGGLVANQVHGFAHVVVHGAAHVVHHQGNSPIPDTGQPSSGGLVVNQVHGSGHGAGYGAAHVVVHVVHHQGNSPIPN